MGRGPSPASEPIVSGWGVFRMQNQGAEMHCMEIDRLPEDVTFREYRGTVERLRTLADSLLPLRSGRASR